MSEWKVQIRRTKYETATVDVHVDDDEGVPTQDELLEAAEEEADEEEAWSEGSTEVELEHAEPIEFPIDLKKVRATIADTLDMQAKLLDQWEVKEPHELPRDVREIFTKLQALELTLNQLIPEPKKPKMPVKKTGQNLDVEG